MDITGVEHRITSAYHPRTNGLTERTNRTIVEMLCKYTREDNFSWPEWLPFICWCYNTRVHSVTNFTPFELMFGRRSNNFIDYRGVDNIDYETALRNRQREIRQMLEVNHVKAIENISKGQERQIKTQNNSHTIEEEILSIGTKVYVRVMGIHDKLYPKFRGPFKISKVTKNNNYILENIFGEPMADTYPRSRLKLIKYSDEELKDDNILRVHKILGHRKNEKGKYEFLVKWKGWSEKDNSWEPSENFLDKGLLTDYWKRVKAGKEKGVKLANLATRFINKSILMSLILMWLIVSAIGLEVEDEFYVCSGASDGSSVLAVESGCVETGAGTSKFFQGVSEHVDVKIISKNTHESHGKAFDCTKEVFQVRTFENFFGAHKKNR